MALSLSEMAGLTFCAYSPLCQSQSQVQCSDTWSSQCCILMTGTGTIDLSSAVFFDCDWYILSPAFSLQYCIFSICYDAFIVHSYLFIDTIHLFLLFSLCLLQAFCYYSDIGDDDVVLLRYCSSVFILFLYLYIIITWYSDTLFIILWRILRWPAYGIWH